MTAVSFDCCGACIPLEPGQTVQDVIDLHTMTCDERQRLQFLATYADDARRDFSVMSDVSVRDLNRHPDKDWPLEISGDAIALHKETHK
ncbi:hypothetical protein [Brevibacterium pigmentatum]|uniref:hypothetical protein n=1 Tax=Brevibacterium pigmentatum TaxID=1496080 RepID=UPI001420AE36|nr:hypothetical protein [Brevibacterium pigmentatum]